jgi:translation initiation factor IF-3
MAADENLDLVKVAAGAAPPVCKIMDYGKFKFERAKQEKEAKKKQQPTNIKEVRLSLNIDTHDFDTKLNNAQRFAKAGNKIKVSIRFKGREMGHPEIGYNLMKKFAESCGEFADVERQAKLDGRNMLMFLAPNRSSGKVSFKNSSKER